METEITKERIKEAKDYLGMAYKEGYIPEQVLQAMLSKPEDEMLKIVEVWMEKGDFDANS